MTVFLIMNYLLFWSELKIISCGLLLISFSWIIENYFNAYSLSIELASGPKEDATNSDIAEEILDNLLR